MWKIRIRIPCQQYTIKTLEEPSTVPGGTPDNTESGLQDAPSSTSTTTD